MNEDPDFEAEWARCAPWIEGALAYGGGTHRIEDVKRAVELREATFWPGPHCAVVSEINTYPRLKAFNFWLAGGDLDELRTVIEPIATAYAKDHGCDVVTITGRAGWARALGYTPLFHTCFKELR